VNLRGFEVQAIVISVSPLPLDGWLYKKYKRIQKNRMQDILRNI